MEVGKWYKFKNGYVGKYTGRQSSTDGQYIYSGGLTYYAVDVDCEVEVIEKRPKTGSFWCNVYPTNHYYYVLAHKTREQADLIKGEKRVACVELKWTEGEGL